MAKEIITTSRNEAKYLTFTMNPIVHRLISQRVAEKGLSLKSAAVLGLYAIAGIDDLNVLQAYPGGTLPAEILDLIVPDPEDQEVDAEFLKGVTLHESIGDAGESRTDSRVEVPTISTTQDLRTDEAS